MFARAVVALALTSFALAACAPIDDPTLLEEQKPYVRLTVSTEVPVEVATALPPTTQGFDLSSTFAFDHLCGFEHGLAFSVRADAAPAIQADFAHWAPIGSRYAVDCTDESADCLADRVRLRWDADGGRFDARPAKKGEGVPQATLCSASFVADAIDPDMAVLEGDCTNLLGSFTKTGTQPVFGPVNITFRALCRRP